MCTYFHVRFWSCDGRREYLLIAKYAKRSHLMFSMSFYYFPIHSACTWDAGRGGRLAASGMRRAGADTSDELMINAAVRLCLHYLHLL